jgi:hypothetical protein
MFGVRQSLLHDISGLSLDSVVSDTTGYCNYGKVDDFTKALNIIPKYMKR